MKMTTTLLAFAAAIALPTAVFAQGPQPGFSEKVKIRYCEKLREGPQEFAQFVNANRLVHGYTHSDFAATSRQERPKYDCSTLLPADRDAKGQSPTKKG